MSDVKGFRMPTPEEEEYIRKSQKRARELGERADEIAAKYARRGKKNATKKAKGKAKAKAKKRS